MVLKGAALQSLIDKYDAEAEKNYNNYQATGCSRYERAQHKAEDLADTLRVAMNHVDEHAKLGFYQAQLHNFAVQARNIKEPGEARPLVQAILAVAQMENLIRREETCL